MSLRDELHRALQEFYDSSEPGPAGMTVNEELVDRVLMPVIERALATERVATIEECKRAAQAAPTFSNDLIGRGKSYAVKRIDELSHDRSAPDEILTKAQHEQWEKDARIVEAMAGCNCAAVDIGVGTLHEPTCGLVRPEDAAAAIRAQEN